MNMENFISSLKLGEAETHRNLTLFPVYSDQARFNGYTLLEDAIQKNKLFVAEIDEGGSVPELKVLNKCNTDVFILDGEELIGAKQNRIANTSIIIGHGKEVVIPVSCVEEGRWHYRSKTFESGDSQLYAALRRKKAKSVSESLRKGNSYMSDQGEIWDDIKEKSCLFSVKSETSAMHDIYESYEDELKKYEMAFKPHSEQAGFVAMIDNKIVGCDIFGISSILPKVYKKLLKGYILDALEKTMGKHKEQSRIWISQQTKAKAFIESLGTTKRESYKSVGEGVDMRFEGETINGFGLIDNDQVVHMAAFAE